MEMDCHEESTITQAFGLTRETTMADIPPQTASPSVPARPHIVLVTATQPRQRGFEDSAGFMPYLLTNFELPEQLQSSGAWHSSTSWPIWQAVQATSAAKTYFPAVEFEGTEYIDGAFASNNPSEIAILLGSVLRHERA